MSTPRAEYPRPQFERAEWLNLNGTWDFDFDDANQGLAQEWYAGHDWSRRIVVPFPFQSECSGIADTDLHDWVWYRREFSVPENWNEKQILLHFGAIDYRAWVWVNGVSVACHEGGHTPFQANVTRALHPGKNEVVIRVEDLSADKGQPRGKQYWERKSHGIFYTRTTGIWQTVWLEPVSAVHLIRAKLTPDLDAGTVTVDYVLSQAALDAELDIQVSFGGRAVAAETLSIESRKGTCRLSLGDFTAGGNGQVWSPEHPNLYEIAYRVQSHGHVIDQVKSYFGVRKVAVDAGRILLNNQPYYMKLVLDQGYFPQGLLAAPSDADLRRDIELTKEMGFNGVRKHQKIEDPRYLYWADRMGLLVWEEMPSCYTFSEDSTCCLIAEWQEAIQRDYNHPCIVAWVPLNESWGVPGLKEDPRQPQYSASLYHLTKSLDGTRLVISNDGWEHTHSDLCTIHDYDAEKRVLKARYGTINSILSYRPDKRPLFVPGFEYCGEPFMVSEFGGIAYKKSDWEGWGYSAARDDDEFARRYFKVVSAMLESPLVQGFCYTQLTDVEQEINGLLTYDRKPKIDLRLIRDINEGKALAPTQSGQAATRNVLAPWGI